MVIDSLYDWLTLTKMTNTSESFRPPSAVFAMPLSQ